MVVPSRRHAEGGTFYVRALNELDALVSEHVMGESPSVHWEDAEAQLQFESLEEAIEAMRDPFFRDIFPRRGRGAPLIQEVKEFRPYSTQLGDAWRVIEQLGSENVKIERVDQSWRVAFGMNPEVEARTLGVAICLAALGCRGIEVALDAELDS